MKSDRNKMFFFLLQAFAASEENNEKSLNLSKTWKALIPTICMIALVLIGVLGFFIWGRNLDDIEPDQPGDEEEANDANKPTSVVEL